MLENIVEDEGDFDILVDRTREYISNQARKLFDHLFYMKKSIGRGGEIINVCKFRTMDKNADVGYDEAFSMVNYLGKPINDSRITEYGRTMRKFWLDEIPQVFYNLIYKKNMKIVGYRPHMSRDLDRYPKHIRDLMRKRMEEEGPAIFGVNYSEIDIVRTARNLLSILSFGLIKRKEISSEEGWQRHLALYEKYEKDKQRPTVTTDFNYLSRIMFNIATLSVSSS